MKQLKSPKNNIGIRKLLYGNECEWYLTKIEVVVAVVVVVVAYLCRGCFLVGVVVYLRRCRVGLSPPRCFAHAFTLPGWLVRSPHRPPPVARRPPSRLPPSFLLRPPLSTLLLLGTFLFLRLPSYPIHPPALAWHGTSPAEKGTNLRSSLRGTWSRNSHFFFFSSFLSGT